MVSAHPKLRDDLIVTRLGEGDEVSFVVKDPLARKFYRLEPAEAFIAGALDGKSTLADIQRDFESACSVPLAKEKLERFVARLDGLGLLDAAASAPDATSRRAGPRREPLRGPGLLYIKLKTLDPDRALGVVEPHLGSFFTRRFVWTAIVLSTIAVAIVASNWDDYVSQTRGLITTGNIPAFIIVALAVSGLHELAHAFTCKRFGGKVYELGFILIYFLPAFYCNVSDAWLFTEKKKKLWVSFAGVFFQMFIWSLAAIVWRIADQESRVSDFCCVAIGTTGLSTLFNLSPLLKLDGYYLLVDYLGIPNLRKRAFEYLISKARKWFRPAVRTVFEATKREKKIYWIYGVSAGIYSVAVLGFVLWKMADYVFSNFQGSGVVFFGCALVLMVTGSLDRWASEIRNAFEGGKWHSAKRRKTLVVCASIALALLIVLLGRWELKVSNKAQLLPSSRASVRAGVEGTIREIVVDEGDTVASGALLAQLDDTEYRTQMNEAKAEIAKWTAEAELLEKGPLKEEVTRLTKLVEKERTKVAFAEKEFGRMRELAGENLVAPTQFEEANEKLDVARKDLEHAESELKLLLTGSRPEKIRAATAEIERLQSTYEFYSDQVARTRIVAPIRGVVSTHHVKDKAGEFVEAGDEVCQIVDCRTMLLEIPVSEKDVTEVTVGQRVKFRARSIPKVAFHGRVVAVSPVAGKNTERTVVTVTSELENPEFLLRPGMTGNAKIYCGKRRIIDLWTRRIIRFIRVEFWW